MNRESRPPDHHGPPTPRATGADTVFAFALAGLLLVLAGGLLTAGGGLPGLARYLPGAEAPRPAPETAPPAAAGPIMAPPSASPNATPLVPTTPLPSDDPAALLPSRDPMATASPSATPAGPITVNLYRDGVFVHEVDDQTCVAAAVQGTLNLIRLNEDGGEPDISATSQRALYDRIVALTTDEDSHVGGTGPGGWAALLTEEGYPYEVRAYPSRTTAMRAAARAIQSTGRPVGILAWTGIHSWVMTGFTATADPATTKSFSVTTAYVMDPWYPWVSTRWPRSEAPNAPRNTADLAANFLPFDLRSGPYPGRDGQFVLVVPLEH
jgi:hypothetical protein